MNLLKEHVNLLMFLSNLEDETLYDCEICSEKGWQWERNCQHEIYKEMMAEGGIEEEKARKSKKYSIKRPEVRHKVRSRKFLMPDGSTIDYCPMSIYDKWYADLVSLIMWSEDIKILPFMPPALMEQANVYVEARWVVMNQLAKIRRYEEKKAKEKQKSNLDKN